MIHILSESIEYYQPGTVASVIFFSLSRMLTFAVPGFVFSAGIKFAHKYEYSAFNYLSFIKGRILKIFIPYLFCAIIYYLYFTFYCKYFSFNIGEFVLAVFDGSIAAPFYFIVFMMQIYILSPLILFFYRSFPAKLGIMLALAITLITLYLTKDNPNSNKIFLNYFLYWIIGCYVGIDFRNKREKIKQKKLFFLIPGVVLTILYVIFSYLRFLGTYESFLTDIIKVAYCAFVPLTYLSFMPRTVGYFAEEFSAATFYVFLIHCLVIFEIQHIMDVLRISSIALRLVVLIIFTYTISILLSVGYSKIKKKIFGSNLDY